MLAHNYTRLALLLGIHLVVMFVITYALVDRVQDIYANLNRVYMALLMVMPMAISMVAVMSAMYPSPQLNGAIYGISGVVIIGVLLMMRTQTFIGDEQFLRSMIPHHSSAIVMCEESSITDPEIQQLCESIVRTQKEEITQMNAILNRL